MTAFRNNDISMSLRRFYKLHMHRSNCLNVLFYNRFNSSPAFCDIPSQSSYESNVVGRVDKNFYIHLFQQTGLGEDQDSFNNYYRLRRNCPCFDHPSVRFEIVERQIDRLACLQLAHVVNQKIVVQRIRMIEIRDLAVIEREVFKIAVIRILLNKNYLIRTNRFENSVSNSCFSRTGSTTN